MRVGVVVPCFKVTKHVLKVLEQIGPEVHKIYAVDDCCPENSGDLIERESRDSRVVVLRHAKNLGVGGAVMSGYSAGLKDGMDVMVKLDGDGQMDPAILKNFLQPILAGDADYVKGNRFFSVAEVRSMPSVRLFGNAALSIMTKLSSGYWKLFDPTNGYTAIHSRALMALYPETLSKRYFFETDMLIRLGEIRAVVVDIPMKPVYADETSGLRIRAILGEFIFKHIAATFRRIGYSYFLRDFNVASLALLVGLPLLIFGVLYGAVSWMSSIQSGSPATSGTVMIAALSIILGFQLLMFFLSYDVSLEPKQPLQKNSVVPTFLPSWDMASLDVDVTRTETVFTRASSNLG